MTCSQSGMRAQCTGASRKGHTHTPSSQCPTSEQCQNLTPSEHPATLGFPEDARSCLEKVTLEQLDRTSTTYMSARVRHGGQVAYLWGLQPQTQPPLGLPLNTIFGHRKRKEDETTTNCNFTKWKEPRAQPIWVQIPVPRLPSRDFRLVLLTTGLCFLFY